MATEDKNGALHSEKDGRFVSKEKPEDFADMSASELRERQLIYSDDSSPKHTTSSKRRRQSTTNEFATLAMQWAHSDKTEIGEQKFFYRKGKWVLLEKSEDGFVEMGSFNKTQREIVSKEIGKQNERLRNERENERIHSTSLRYKNI
ncbi:MAG: hypothetical protein IJW83_00045 [Clostridia bacterium]|nr:hypothetical protein [Clostridia bacterium]